MNRRIFGLLMLSLAITPSAHAGLLPLGLTVTKESSSAYRFTYSVELLSKAVLKPGDYFTIYDFAGRIEGSEAQPATFVFSSAKVGPTPDLLTPRDDSTISNITWTYSGTATLSGDAWLGDFSVASVYQATRSDDFTGQSHKLSNGNFNNNITDTEVPVPSGVPEPSTLLLAGLSVAGAAGYGWRRRMAASSAVV